MSRAEVVAQRGEVASSAEVHWRWIITLLAAAVITTAVGVVYAKHLNRKLFVELQNLQTQRDNMNIEWGQLQLEQGAWATHSRIEQAARTRLDMRQPAAETVKIVRPR